MDHGEAITDKAKELNAAATAWKSSNQRADEQAERRRLMALLPAGRFLDQDHLTECATGEHGGPNDLFRQGLLRKAGSGQLRQLILRPDEWEALRERAKDARVGTWPARE